MAVTSAAAASDCCDDECRCVFSALLCFD